MPQNKKVTRKLSAILSADVKGYSVLMADDEIHTIDTLKTYRKIISEAPMISSSDVAETVFQAIRNEEFYILTHKQPILKNLIKERMDAILAAFND